MILEAWMLVGAVILGIVQISVQSFALKASAGNRWTVGPRDNAPELGVYAGRLERALRNFQESFPLFAAAVLLVLVMGRSNVVTQTGAILFLAGRIAYLPAYLSAVPYLRTVCWQIATAGLVTVLAGLFLQA